MSKSEQETDDGTPEPDRISAKLVAPLHCTLGFYREDLDQRLVVVTTGHPDGSMDVFALLPNDSARLRRMLERIEDSLEFGKKIHAHSRARFFPADIARSEWTVRKMKPDRYLSHLKLGDPSLANYVTNRTMEIMHRISQKIRSEPLCKDIRREILMLTLTAVDYSRWTH